MTKTSLTLALLLLLASALISGCSQGDASPVAVSADATPVPVQVRMPYREDLYATYEATANIGTEGDAPVVARVPGDVVELLVEEGAEVTAGQPLARLDGERLRLELLAAKADLDRVQGEFDRYRDLVERGVVSKAAFDNLQYDLDALRATYELRRLEYDYTTLRAPIDGQVASRAIRPGQNVGIDDVAFRITDTRELMAELQIPQTELAVIAAGQPAKLRVDSMPGRVFEATIVRISPTVDAENGTFTARAEIDNAAGDLAPGMFARFSIAYERHADALLIPSDALIEEDEQTAVYVVAGATVERRVIRTGIASGNRIEVLEGLGENDQVVVTGHSSLREGSKVLARLGNPETHSG
jgi:membrane fusion protein (multidrug efflux system)